MWLGSETVGYLASGLVLATFTTKRMRPLRTIAILSNIAFIGYGVLDSIVPVLALHLILLPLNIVRLAQLRLETARQRPTAGEAPVLRISDTVLAVLGVEGQGSGRTLVLEVQGPGFRRVMQVPIEPGADPAPLQFGSGEDTAGGTRQAEIFSAGCEPHYSLPADTARFRRRLPCGGSHVP